MSQRRIPLDLPSYSVALTMALQCHPLFRTGMTVQFDGRGFHFHAGRLLAEEEDIAVLEDVLAQVRRKYVLAP